MLNQLPQLPPYALQREELTRVHDLAYLHIAEEDIHQGLLQLRTGDTGICLHSWDVAVKSAGAAVAGVRAVATGVAQRAFSLMRPPGHHATTDRGMGFCILNNIALAAREAQHLQAGSRVLILDWDVHHGNGTQEIFYTDDSVYYCSVHQSNWYPFTGEAAERGLGDGTGHTLNLPLAAGASGDDVLRVLEERLSPAMEMFQPDWVLLSAGFDSHRDDPLGRFNLEDSDFIRLTEYALGLAEQYAQGRLVSILEGGYNLSALASATSAHVQTLAGVNA